MMKKVLFLCTANASRSQMAEGLVNHDFTGKIEAFSAGTMPKEVSRLAVQVLGEIGIDISRATSKHLNTFASERFDYVITLCDNANVECPVFFGGVQRLHIGFPDTPHTNAATEENLQIYRRIRDMIREGLREFFNRELELSHPFV